MFVYWFRMWNFLYDQCVCVCVLIFIFLLTEKPFMLTNHQDKILELSSFILWTSVFTYNRCHLQVQGQVQAQNFQE